MTTETEQPSLREVIEEAAATPETPAPPPPADAPPAPVEDAIETPTESGTVRERGPDGKFAKKPVVADAKPVEQEKLTPKPGDKPPEVKPGDKPAEQKPAEQKPAFRGPQSWKPSAREKLAAADPEVQQEVLRRERDHDKLVQETAETRKVATDFNRVAQQFAFLYAPLGATPIQAAEDLFRTAAMLRTSPPKQKAAMLAAMVRTALPGREGLEMLDAALAGEELPAGKGGGPVQDPRVDQLLAALAEQKAAKEQTSMSSARARLAAFAESHEYYEDVRETMADLMERAVRKGVAMTEDAAYARACELDPEISKILAQKARAEAARTGDPATERARRAASGIRSTPAPGIDQAGDDGSDVRSAIVAAMRSNSGVR